MLKRDNIGLFAQERKPEQFMGGYSDDLEMKNIPPEFPDPVIQSDLPEAYNGNNGSEMPMQKLGKIRTHLYNSPAYKIMTGILNEMNAKQTPKAANNEDDVGMTNAYNTPLSPEQERQFANWTQRQKQIVGRDVAKDLYDYDLKGWWLDNKGQDLSGGHLTDKFKKPNHPTFSDQSIYNGTPAIGGGINIGGSWKGDQFIPPKRNNKSK